jgi:hypothetical protein
MGCGSAPGLPTASGEPSRAINEWSAQGIERPLNPIGREAVNGLVYLGHTWRWRARSRRQCAAHPRTNAGWRDVEAGLVGLSGDDFVSSVRGRGGDSPKSVGLLANSPKRSEITECPLIAAADALGVVTKRGELLE